MEPARAVSTLRASIAYRKGLRLGAGLEGRPLLAGYLADELAALERGRAVLADTDEQHGRAGEGEGSRGWFGDGRQAGDGGWWLSEPDVGRVADGVPARVDRLTALGNAVVPAIPEIIGLAILASEEQR
jgi:hypothetical protein